jgi:two-component system OmpR family response regulator
MSRRIAIVRHPGPVKGRSHLIGAADLCVDAATITSHIKHIRRKFLAVDPRFDASEAVCGADHRWIPQG